MLPEITESVRVSVLPGSLTQMPPQSPHSPCTGGFPLEMVTPENVATAPPTEPDPTSRTRVSLVQPTGQPARMSTTELPAPSTVTPAVSLICSSPTPGLTEYEVNGLWGTVVGSGSVTVTACCSVLASTSAARKVQSPSGLATQLAGPWGERGSAASLTVMAVAAPAGGEMNPAAPMVPAPRAAPRMQRPPMRRVSLLPTWIILCPCRRLLRECRHDPVRG